MADINKTIEIVFGATDQTSSGIGSTKSGLDSVSSSYDKTAASAKKAGDAIGAAGDSFSQQPTKINSTADSAEKATVKYDALMNVISETPKVTAEASDAVENTTSKLDKFRDGVSGAGAKLTSTGDIISGFTDKVSGVTAPLTIVADKLLLAEAAVITMGAAMLAVATNEAAKFQTSVNEIGTLFGATSEQASQFGQQIQAYALGSTQSIDSINKATYAAISAGIDYTKSLEFLNTAEKLSVAGKADLSATTVLLVSTLNAYGASTNDAAKYSDALFQTVKLGQTTIPELSSSLAQVTGVAAAAGIPFDTLTAAIAALTASGLPTSQAITGLKAAISNIIQPSSEAQNAAAALGIQFDAAALKTKGLEGVLWDAYKATGGNVTQMGALFGSVEGLNSALILGGDKVGKFAADLQGMADKAGSTQAAFELMAGNFGAAMQQMQNALTVTFQTAGAPLLESFGGVVNGIADVFKALVTTINAGTFDQVYASLESAANGLKAYLEGVAAALPEAFKNVDFSGLVGSFEGLGKAITGLFGGLDLTKPEDLAKAIQFVVNSTQSLTEVVTGMVASWGPAISQITSLIEKFNAQDASTKGAAGATLGLAQQFEAFKGILTTFSAGLDATGGALQTIAGVMSADLAIKALPAASAGFAALSGGFATLLAATGPVGLVLAGIAAAIGLVTVAANDSGPLFRFGDAAKDAGYKAVDMSDAMGKAATAIQDFARNTANSGTSADAVVRALEGLRDGSLTFAEASVIAGAATKEQRDKLAALSEQFNAATNAAELATNSDQRQAEAKKALSAATDELASKQKNYADAVTKVTTETGKQGQIVFATIDQFEQWAIKTDKNREAQYALGQATDNLVDKTSNFVKVINSDGTVTYQQNLAKAATGATNLATATDKAKAATDAAAKAQEEWNKKLQEMQFQERMEAIKSATEVTVAAITAESSKAVAAFDSIATSIQSTDDSITKLFTTDAPDWDSFGFSIKEAAEAQLEIKKALADAQIKLLEEQIKSMEIRNDLMRQGMPQIVIQADGLEPHITAFMFEILNKIQVRASQLGAEWLVGGGMVGV